MTAGAVPGKANAKPSVWSSALMGAIIEINAITA
jgi:hypothetical protein